MNLNRDEMRKKQYKRAFGTLHTSEDFAERLNARLQANENAEVITMFDKKQKRKMSKAAIAASMAVVIAVSGFGVAYAADAGGIRTTLTVWMHGEQKEVDFTETSPGSYEYTDDEGREHGGGGVAYDMFGRERPLTAEEMAEEISSNIELELHDDGTIWFYQKDIAEDVTDAVKACDDGTLHIKVRDGAVGYYYYDIEFDPGTYEVGAISGHGLPERGISYYEVGK